MSLAKALLEVQKELPAIKPDSKAKVPTKSGGEFSYDYVSLDHLLKVVLPILHSHGLVLTQAPSLSDGRHSLTTMILHPDSDEKMESTMALILPQDNPQGQGSAITYARRYALTAILGISGQRDDDGALASQPAKKSAKPPENPVTTSEKLRKRLLEVAGEADVLRGMPMETTWNELQGLCKANQKSLGAMDEDELKELGLALADYVKHHAKPGGVSFLEHMTTPGGI